MKVSILGGGFSGLTLAYALTKRGIPCEVFERSDRVGGLIGTLNYPKGLVETAANGILCSAEVAQMFSDIDVKFIRTSPESKKRFVFRGSPRRWPFTAMETFGIIKNLLLSLLKGRNYFKPRRKESVLEWGTRIVGRPAAEVLGTVLQGIYAGDPSQLSASLILRKVSKSGSTVAPEFGMGDLINGLQKYLIKKGVIINLSWTGKLPENFPVVYCTPAYETAQLLKIKSLEQIDYLPLVSVTAFYPASARKWVGFGCLFPRDSGFRALGVLFNSVIFENRSKVHSETWILGGALDREITKLNPDEIGDIVVREHYLLNSKSDIPLSIQVTKWDRAIPHYSIELEEILEEFNLPNGVYVHGNFLGGLGLGKILTRSHELAEKIQKDLV